MFIFELVFVGEKKKKLIKSSFFMHKVEPSLLKMHARKVKKKKTQEHAVSLK